MRGHARYERVRSSYIFRLEHLRHDLFRGRHGPVLHNGSRHFARRETTCPKAVAALIHIERMRESQDGVLGGGIGWPRHLGYDAARPTCDVDDAPGLAFPLPRHPTLDSPPPPFSI